MYRGGRGGGRGGRSGGGYQGGRGPRLPGRKQYFETDAKSTSGVVLKPVPPELKRKFTQLHPGPGEEHYARYNLELDEERRVERSVPRRRGNLQDIRKILVQKLSEGFQREPEFKLECQARVGKLVWFGESIERPRDHRGMLLSKFEGPPYYENGRPKLKNEYYTRATVKDSIMSELERCHGPHDPAYFSLQIIFHDVMPDGGKYMYFAFVNKDPATGRFQLQRLTNIEAILVQYTADMVCFGRSHDIRIATKYFSLTKPEPTDDVTRIIDSISLSEGGELKMILKSGPIEVQMVRHRKRFVFHLKDGRDWLIKYTKIVEQPVPQDYRYQNRVVSMLDAGHDNVELEVALERILEQDADIGGVVEEILQLIEFSLEVVDFSEDHLDK